PNVDAAGAVSNLPLSGSENLTAFEVEGKPLEHAEAPSAEYRACSPGYFRAMGTPLLRGRFFTDQDDGGYPDVAIVNQTLSRRAFGSENPVGRRIRFRSASSVGAWLTIVGVV